MVKFYARDRKLSQEEMEQFKRQPNENKRFKFLYGPERLEQFKQYRNQLPEDLRDMNVWIKPFKKGGNEFMSPREFDEEINAIIEANERRAEQRSLEVSQETPEERQERLRREELAREEGRNITPIVESDGLEYLGADGKYRVYKATNYTGAHNFALPRSEGKGWCITGSGWWGTAPHQGPSYWRSQVQRTTDDAFYFFMTTPAKDSYCVFKCKRDGGDLIFVPNSTDSETPVEPVSAKLPLDIAGLTGGKPMSSVKKIEGPFYTRGSTLIGLTGEGLEMDFIMVRADISAIGVNAICGTRNLKELKLTSNTSSIQRGGISANIALKTINFDGSNMNFGEGALSYNGNLLTLDFPANSNVAPKILKECKRLQRVTLPQNVRSIGEQAFEGCDHLILVEIPSTCTNIGENAFNGCKSLTIKAHFAEKPAGWYNNIEKHVNRIVWLEEPVEEIQAEEVVAEDSVDDTDDVRVLDTKSKVVEKKKINFQAKDRKLSQEEMEQFKRQSNENKKFKFLYGAERLEQFKKYRNQLPEDLRDINVWIKPLMKGGNEFMSPKEFDEEIKTILKENKKSDAKVEDSKCNDIKPKKGEKKKEFLQRFMKETEKEYPDEKQRYAVANSYWERKKVKDAESIVEIKDKEAEKEEVVEDKTKKEVVTFTIQTLKKEALDDLKASKNKNDLDERYDKWLEKSEDLAETGKITVDQQEAFEDELWEIYNDIDLK